MASSCTTLARKRKGNATAEKTEQITTKKKCCSDKAMPKKTHAVLVKSVNSIEPSLLADEVQHNIEDTLTARHGVPGSVILVYLRANIPPK